MRRLSKNNLFRYFKVILKTRYIFIFILIILISNTYFKYLNDKYEEFYNNTPQDFNAKAVIIDNGIEKEFNKTYTVKVKEGEFRNKKFYILVKKNNNLEYGDLINVKGEYIVPSVARNYKSFNYREYLKSKKIFGTIKQEGNVEAIEKNRLNLILLMSNKIREGIVNKCNLLLPKDTGKLLIGVLIGDKSEISEDIIDNFKTSNLSHMLAVSGAHTSYIALGVTFLLNKSKISKKWVYIITIIILILFMFITNFTPSVTRACFMSIIILLSNLFHRKADFTTSISLSLLTILIINPFLINEIGLQLSYLGTIGIVLFNKNVKDILDKFHIHRKISKILSIPISAQMSIAPIMAVRFNTISFTFFISNILASPFLGINIILGFILIFVSLISYTIAKMLAIPLNILLKVLIKVSELCAKIPLSKVIIKTPYLISIIFYYLIVFTLSYIYSIEKSSLSLRLFERKIVKIVNKKINKKNIKKIISIVLILIFFFQTISFFYTQISKDLKIYFIDVGQGDSCLIITPKSKNILIDGGEGKTDVLLSCLLDRRIKTIDYILISHFDSDHCNGLIEVIKNLKVKNIIISKQAYFCDEYKKIANIINSKRINVIQVKQNDKLNLEEDLSLNVLYPPKELKYDDLNNNSIVAKLIYNTFSILFTGDIEMSEKDILEKYKKELKSDVLKIAHHGSSTSSSEEFLKTVNPKIVLIGVGKNNKFGHPSEEVIERLKDIKCKIYRTDKMGEIKIKVDKNKRIKINTMIK